MRIATLDLSPELFIEFIKLCKDGPPRRIIVEKNALPEDARVVSVTADTQIYPYRLKLVIESESFADVPKGSEPPELEPVWFKTVYDEITDVAQ